MSECLLLMRHCLKRGPFWTSKVNRAQSRESFHPPVEEATGCFYAGYWTVISLALLGERGWREECDERVWGYSGSKRSVSVCWRDHSDRWPRFVCWQSFCYFVYKQMKRYGTLSSSLDSFLFSSVSRTRSRSYFCLYSVSNSSRSLRLDGEKHTHTQTYCKTCDFV